MKPSTRTATETVDPNTGALTFPIYQTSAYELPKGEKYRYTRESNPTVEELAGKIALLEGAPAGSAFSSGMGAITSTFLSLLKPGSKLLIQRDVFARSFKFATGFLRDWGVDVIAAGPGTDSVLEAMESSPDLVFVEGVSNPTLRVIDLPRLSRAASKHGSTLVVDSTFATPFNELPYRHGADLIVHSASKFIAGHNDVICGLAAGREDIIGKVDSMRRTMGSSLDPHAAFLVLRGLRTLKVRIDAINKTAAHVARKLEESRQVHRVFYPGLQSHPDRNVACRLLQGYGGVVTFELDGSVKNALNAISRLKLVMPANTLGGANSTISHPWTMSHRGLTDEERGEAGITQGMLRLSIGLEDRDEILGDILQAIGGS